MKYYIHLITLSLLLSQEINFINSKLIDLQGINSDYDVVMDFDGLFYGNIYLTWINQQDSLYSVYSAQILVDSQDPVLIYSDTVPNIHPTIDNTNSENSLNIVWQSRVNNFWQLKRYDGATISTFSDSVSDNTKPSLSRNMLAWLNDDTIKVKCIDCPNDTLFIIDSLNCENPQIISYDDEFSWSVAYEKEIDTVSRVYLANYSKNQWTGNESFNIEQISGNFESRNPVFDYFGTLSYESLIDGYWKSIITWGSDTTRNQDYNCTNPMSFTYAYVNRDVEDCMFVYESDSIEGNNEIYYETEWYDTWGIGQRGNLSNMEGADTNPFITLIWDTVTSFLGTSNRKRFRNLVGKRCFKSKPFYKRFIPI